MPRNVESKRITEEYKQEAREAILRAIEKHREYIRGYIECDPEETDEYFEKKARRKIQTSVEKDLFKYAMKHHMLSVSRTVPTEDDTFKKRHREPYPGDMPKCYTDLDKLVPDYPSLVQQMVKECRPCDFDSN